MVWQAATRIREDCERLYAQTISFRRVQDHEHVREPLLELGRQRLHGVFVPLVDTGRIRLRGRFSPVAVLRLTSAESVQPQRAVYISNFDGCDSLGLWVGPSAFKPAGVAKRQRATCEQPDNE